MRLSSHAWNTWLVHPETAKLFLDLLVWWVRAMIRAYLYALGAVALWSVNFVIANLASTSMTPIELAFYRWSVALILLIPISRKALSKLAGTMTKPEIIRLSVSAAFGISAFNTLIYWAGRYAHSVSLALIAVSSPAFITMINRIFYAVKVRPITWLGVFFATLGCALLILKGNPGALFQLNVSVGDLIMLLAAVTFAVYTVIQKLPHGVTHGEYLFLNILLGDLFLLPFYVTNTLTVGVPRLDMHVVTYVLYLGVFASLVAFYLWNACINAVGSVQTGVVYYVLPIFVFGIDYFWGGARPNKLMLISFAAILVGVLIVHFTSTPKNLEKK
ncbi:DMT family transporter [Acidithiobacillus ferrianus]|uniref:EamA family transporter n=2 Tax=Acidithiobacillus ferrianus TaxID=2678518 RepID=A0A845UI50_9PROT|nr:EamA family transporter [Acidithiobacillus ferrianus]